MIISGTFAIGHIPRTGGDACARYFAVLKRHGMQVEIDSAGDHAKHDPFAARESLVPGDRQYVVTLRRLPAFYLSYIRMCTRDGIYPEFKPLPWPPVDCIRGFNRNWGPTYNREFGWPLFSLADSYLHHIVGHHAKLDDVVVLRQECLRHDVLEFASSHFDMSREAAAALRNVSHDGRDYDHSPSAYWSRGTIDAMYRNNPAWASLERANYD